MKRIAFLFLFFAATAIASVSASQDHLSRLLQEETVLVVHVDFTKIDAANVVLNNKELLDKIRTSLGLDDPENMAAFFPADAEREMFRRMTTDWNVLAEMLDGGKTVLTEMFGVEEAFFVLNFRAPTPCYVALPKTEKLNSEMIRQTLKNGPSILVHEIPDFLLLALNENFARVRSEERAKQLLEQVVPENPPKDRKVDSRFSPAFQSVEKFPVKLVISLPDYFAKVLRDTRPTLPVPLERVDLAATVADFRGLAVGIDPVELHAVCHVEAASEDAAVQLRRTAEILADVAFDAWFDMIRDYENMPETSPLFDFVSVFGKSLLEISTRENFEALKKDFLPDPQGNRFTVQIDRDRVARFAELLIPFGMQIAETGRAAARRMQCTNKLKNLALAMHNYHEVNGHLPPVYTVDENGKPLHSWRVLLLPYVEQQAMYEAIRLDEPWDSEHNRRFHDKMPSVFRCPQLTKGKADRDSAYCVVVGEETFGRPGEKGLKFGEITDGTSNTIMILERKEPVCWMAPIDITQEDAYLGIDKKAEGIGSNHEAGVNAAFCDGSVRFISETIAPDVLKAILTVSGGESDSL